MTQASPNSTDPVDDPPPATAPPRPPVPGAWPLFFLSALIFIVYLKTGAPGAWWGDGLELACAAKTLGVAHPTGYPLYTVLGWSAMHALPWIDPGRALTIFSAFCCAAAAWLMGLIALCELRAPRNESAENGGDGFAFFGAAGAALFFGFARTVWEHATFAEVYPLTLLFTVQIVAFAYLRAGARPAHRSALFGLLCGLAALNHYSLVEVAPLVALALLDWGRDTDGRIRVQAAARNFAAFFAAATPCLLGYLYLPLRAAANPAINWGDPSSLDRFLWVVRGGDFVGANFLQGGSALAAAFHGLRIWLEWWGTQLAPERFAFLRLPLGCVIVAGALAGCRMIARRRPLFGWGLIATLLASAFVLMFYRILDPEGYVFPALAPALLGWIELIRWTSEKTPALSRFRFAHAALPSFVAIAVALFHYPEVDKSWDDGPHRWAKRALDALPPNAVIITRQGFDGEIYALWSEQILRGRRPDVTVFGSGFIFHGWYRKYFESAGRPRVPVYAADRPIGEKAYFDAALVAGVIAPNIVDRPVFATFQDPILTNYFSPTPARLLLPDAYWRETAYKLRPNGEFLYELHPPKGAFSSPPTREELRRFFAGISENHLRRYEELFGKNEEITTETQRRRE